MLHTHDRTFVTMGKVVRVDRVTRGSEFEISLMFLSLSDEAQLSLQEHLVDVTSAAVAQ